MWRVSILNNYRFLDHLFFHSPLDDEPVRLDPTTDDLLPFPFPPTFKDNVLIRLRKQTPHALEVIDVRFELVLRGGGGGNVEFDVHFVLFH